MPLWLGVHVLGPKLLDTTPPKPNLKPSSGFQHQARSEWPALIRSTVSQFLLEKDQERDNQREQASRLCQGEADQEVSELLRSS